MPKFADRKGQLPAQFAIADITNMDDPLWDVFQIKITPTIVVFREGRLEGRLDGRPVVGLRNADLDRMGDLIRGLPPSRAPASNDRSAR